LYRAERPGQTRGIPRATPALQTLPIMRRQELATLYSAETAANFAMYLKSNSPAIDPADSPADFAEIELTRNMLTTLPAGWEIGQVEPKQPGPLYEMFQRQALMSFCRCTNMPYTLAAGTGKDANFSSFKGDMKNVWEPEVQVEQNRIQMDIVERLWQWFLESA
ncbi:MAG: phage portal protein, partial [Planctomyces sp.]